MAVSPLVAPLGAIFSFGTRIIRKTCATGLTDKFRFTRPFMLINMIFPPSKLTGIGAENTRFCFGHLYKRLTAVFTNSSIF